MTVRLDVTFETCTIEWLSGQSYVYGKKRGFCSLEASGSGGFPAAILQTTVGLRVR